MRFSLALLPIALTYSLRIVDQSYSDGNVADDIVNLGIDNNNYDRHSAISPNSIGDKSIVRRDYGLSFWQAGGAVIGNGLTGFLDSVLWAGGAVAAIAAAELDSLNPQPMQRMTQEEKEAFMAAEVAKVKESGCEEAHWGRVFCALGVEGPLIFPGVFEYVFDVYSIRSGPCVNPAVKPPSYCCSHSMPTPTSSDYTRIIDVGISCIPLD